MPQQSTVTSLTVLVVEDEALILDLVVQSLEEGGFVVEETAAGDQAIALLERKNGPEYRVLVTDIDLGSKINGWNVAKRARELYPELPVIYMTGGSAGDWSANGVPNSVLVPKPFAPAQIVTAVAQLLNAATIPGT